MYKAYYKSEKYRTNFIFSNEDELKSNVESKFFLDFHDYWIFSQLFHLIRHNPFHIATAADNYESYKIVEK